MTFKNTKEEFNHIIQTCQSLFAKKYDDYGTSWSILRPISIIEQIYIKAFRIRTIQDTGVQKVQDSIANDFMGIINYSIIGLIQMALNTHTYVNIPWQELHQLYNKQVALCLTTLDNKNHDYGEAWRHLSEKSLIDLILMKIYRMKQLTENHAHPTISEGIEYNYIDIINYAVFALIKIKKT